MSGMYTELCILMHVSVYQVKLALLRAKFMAVKTDKEVIEKTPKGRTSELLYLKCVSATERFFL